MAVEICYLHIISYSLLIIYRNPMAVSFEKVSVKIFIIKRKKKNEHLYRLSYKIKVLYKNQMRQKRQF